MRGRLIMMLVTRDTADQLLAVALLLLGGWPGTAVVRARARAREEVLQVMWSVM